MSNPYERVEELHRRVTELGVGQIHGVASDNDQDARLAALEAAVEALNARLPNPIPVVTRPSSEWLAGKQLAPAPDYRCELRAAPEQCGCEEAMDLREQLAVANDLMLEIRDSIDANGGALRGKSWRRLEAYTDALTDKEESPAT